MSMHIYVNAPVLFTVHVTFSRVSFASDQYPFEVFEHISFLIVCYYYYYL